LKKGAAVYLEGKIENRSYDDKSGNKKYVSEVVVDSFGGKMVMLGGGGQTEPIGEESQVPPETSSPDDDLPF